MNCKHGVLPSKQCCAGCAELDNTLYRCNQEIIKQTYRAELAEAQAAAMLQVLEKIRGEKICRSCGNYAIRAGDDYEKPSKFCESDPKVFRDETESCDRWVPEFISAAEEANKILQTLPDASSALLAENKRMREALEEILEFDTNYIGQEYAYRRIKTIAKAALEDVPK